MASRSKRRKTVSQTGQTETHALVKECMAAALPVIESVVKECIESRNRQSSESPAVQPGPSVPDRPSTQESTETVVRDNPTFQAIIQSGIESSSTLTAVPENNFPLGIARPVGLGVDTKIKAKIYANEYIKLASLIPKSSFEQEPKFKSVEKDGQLVFIKAIDNGCIKTLPQWTEAFHVFVAIHCTKYPYEVGQLMTYAQIIQGIAKSCGDDAAINYDEKFRQWRQVAPRACPWDRKNSELYHKQNQRSSPFETHTFYRVRSGCTVLPIDVSTQTRCQDLPPFAFPEVPESREDILAYIQWLEGLSFSVHQRKKVAEEKLRSVMSNTPDLLAEREKRRKQLEAENLRLRKELADLKAAHLLFPEL
ncbi:uncharacterized protein LOC128174739 [Crassostrea angulata]|uniref:uncharacterized protein LOC128174739 n=1 Tax=Magallana angulata TaxID=2784310 RepID=UPI0022B122C7|nr:uncharacterized protein LOC128174739 [Crassostrea angulata]